MAFPFLYISLFHSEMLAALGWGFTEKLQFTGSSPCSLSLGENRHGKQRADAKVIFPHHLPVCLVEVIARTAREMVGASTCTERPPRSFTRPGKPAFVELHHTT